MVKRKLVVLGVSASIAIYKGCELVRRLQDEGCDVTVVMTPEAAQLISPVVFQSLSGNRVYSEMFDEPDAWEVEHVSLARKAGLILIAPATANTIGKIAGGICDDLLSCTVCATKAPVLIAPAMNEGMYTNPLVQANIEKLKRHGVVFIGPKKGRLACGTTGVGCLADVAEIVSAVKRLLK